MRVPGCTRLHVHTSLCPAPPVLNTELYTHASEPRTVHVTTSGAAPVLALCSGCSALRCNVHGSWAWLVVIGGEMNNAIKLQYAMRDTQLSVFYRTIGYVRP